MTYLDIYVYTCLPGYTTTDEVITLCAPDGNFTMPFPPNCTGILPTTIETYVAKLMLKYKRFVFHFNYYINIKIFHHCHCNKL